MTHNLRPEIVPLVLEVLRDSPKITRRLARNDGGTMCFCFEGAVCEAYRRAHPDKARWSTYSNKCPDLMRFVIDDDRGSCFMSHVISSPTLLAWATIDGRCPRFGDDWAAILNDRGWSFERFIRELEG